MTLTSSASSPYLDASAAANRLGVSRATLYAYVSRGRVRSVANPHDSRQSLYLASDVEALIARRGRLRRPRVAAATALDWGLPVLTTHLTRIEAGTLAFRGTDAIAFASSGDLEATAGLLWQCDGQAAFAAARALHDPLPDRILGLSGATERILSALAESLAGGESAPGERYTPLLAAGAVLRLADAAAGRRLADGAPLHRAIADGWSRPRAAESIRLALVLSADHELNASTFAVRVAASTGAALVPALMAGTAALSGPRHGGTSARVARMFAEIAADGDPARSIRDRLARGDPFPGFGHPLYPDGDPRAKAMLASLPRDGTDEAMLAEIAAQTGLAPSLDAGLVMTATRHGLPDDAPLALFAIGRSIGWVAHAMEQQALGTLIRPRAAYVEDLG